MDHFLAYIDPGSGSLIIQALIASVVAIPFFFRQQIARLVRVVRRGGSENDAATQPRDPAS
jgi:hypothetical protein